MKRRAIIQWRRSKLDVDENDGLASLQQMINSPFKSVLAAFVFVYCNSYNSARSSFLDSHVIVFRHPHLLLSFGFSPSGFKIQANKETWEEEIERERDVFRGSKMVSLFFILLFCKDSEISGWREKRVSIKIHCLLFCISLYERSSFFSASCSFDLLTSLSY